VICISNRRHLRGLIALVMIGVALLAHPHESTAESGSGTKVALVKVTSAKIPVDIASRDGDPGLYIAEQNGLIVRYDPTTKTRTTALNLKRFTRADVERGLLGLIFHPDGTHLYANYTDSRFGTVVARYAMRANNTADTATRTVLFQLPRSRPSVHNGGSLAFGPGGRLYVSTGDSGFGNDPARLALDKSSFFGKILSLEPLARDATSAAPKVWSIGLRNPWRFEFDDKMNLWVPDVGQNKWEEVNVVWAEDGSGRDANFGWSAFEGRVRNNKDQNAYGHNQPVYVYPHGEQGCSVIGGTRVRDESLPGLLGWYVFGDYCTGRISAMKVSGQKVQSLRTIAKGAGFITAIRTIASGQIYVLSLGGGIRTFRAAG
jgi:glucose/arabinose dehydrogenase